MMIHKSVMLSIALIAIVATPLFGVALAQSNLVGVKSGDWIRYQVTETGNPTSEYNITWARMDITGVQGEEITVNVQTAYANGTLYPENNITLNLATGAIGDGFFVPLNLNPGDRYSTEYEGIINITSVGRIEAGGAPRTVLIGVANQSTYNWDRETGIMVAATSNLPGCVMYTKTSATNIWEPQILGLDRTIFYQLIAVIVVAAAIVVVVAAILVWHKKSPIPTLPSR